MNQPVRFLMSFMGNCKLHTLVILMAQMLYTNGLMAQSQTFDVSGSFTVPAGVTSITVRAIGGGGGGGNGSARGGGGGGAYATKTFSVTPGTVYTVTVGGGGAAGSDGGSSSFGTDVIAVGGTGATANAGAAGGLSTACTPTTGAFSGGTGGTSSATGGDNDAGGGGGGAATSSNSGRNGANGTSTTPGAGGLAGGGAGSGGGASGAGDGGDGADDVDNVDAEGGFAPGGGGGGQSENTGSDSGAGADGRVTVTWTCLDDITNMSTTASSPVCTGIGATVTVTSTTLADGTYTVYYNLSGTNTATAQSASMAFSGVTGTFSTIVLANSGSTTITITSVGCANVVTGQDFTATGTVNAAPATPGAITASTTTICSAQTGITYSVSAVSGATSYNWTVPAGWSITGGATTTTVTVTSGSADQNGTVSVTASNSCGTSAASTLSVNLIDNIGFNNNTATNTLSICAGTTGTTINGGTAPSGPSYQWEVSTTGPGSGFGNAAGTSTSEDYTVSSTYYNAAGTYYFRRQISSSTAACDGPSDVVTLTVNANPAPTIAVTETSGAANNDGTICNGASVGLDAGSFSSYVWAPGGATTQTINVNPSSTTTYTVTVTSAAGCTGTDTQVITVNPAVTINSISATPSTICAGASSTLAVTPANNSTQSFSNNNLITIPDFGNASPFPSNISVSGLPTSGVTVANVSFNNFSHEDPDDADIYLLGPNNQVIWLMSDAGGTGSISNFDLTYADGGAAQPSGSALTNGATYAPADLTATETTPGGATLITTMASFTGNMNGTWSLHINDDSNDTNSGDLEGWTITFNTPNYTYAWSNGPTTSSQSVSPTMTTTYTVSVTANGCTSTASTTVTVNAPTCSITGADPVCAGSTGNVYTAPGGMSAYSWSVSGNGTAIGSTTGSAVTVTAGAAGTYTVNVTVTNSGCTSSCSKTVTVNANPTAMISGTLAFCAGGSTTLTASGGTSYVWDDLSTNAMRNVNAGGTYTVTVTDANGCTDTETATVTMNANPTAMISGTLSFCAGGSTTLTASGGTSYVWDDLSTNAMRNVNAGGTYTVTATDANGCTDTETATVTMNANPTAMISGTLSFCAGGSTTLTASGGTSYVWDDLSSNAMRSVNAGGTYTVTATDANGCTDTETATVTMNANPTAMISGTLGFCTGGSTTLTASGGTSYVWDDLSTNAMRSINAAGMYTVTVTNANGCTDTETVSVAVNPLPTAAIIGTLSFCTGSSTTLMATGGVSYLWDDNSTSDMRMVNAVGTYTVQVTDGNGCTDTETATVSQSAPATADAGGPYSTCGLTPVNIMATANGSGMWSGGMGSFGSMTATSTTYTPAMSELGTTVVLTWTTDDPDGPDACPAVSDNANLSVSGQEIEVKGNGTSISDGDATPASVDLTDFGWTTVAAGTISRTFSIVNTGSSPLTLTGGMPVTLSGPDAGDFTVTMQPTSPVAISGGMTMFQIEFDPSAAGMRSATVSIANNDCDEAPFTFDIQGKGTTPQAISVYGNSNQIANRATTAGVSDDTDFGSVGTGGGMVSHTFTINNIANGSPLMLTGTPKVTIADRDASDFTVTAQPSSLVDGGSSTTFTIKFQPSAAGLRTAQVIITHNDLPENPFVFTINGTGF